MLKDWEMISVKFQQFQRELLAGAIVLIIACITIWAVRKRRLRLPPGPFGVPLFGYLPFLGKYPHKTFSKLASQYGPIFSLYLGNEFTIVLNSYGIIKEAFLKQGEIFSDRPEKNAFQIPTEHQMAGLSGKPRMVQRKFLDKCFKEQGVGTTTAEAQIMEEVQCFIESLQKLANTQRPVNFIESLGVSVSNNTCILVFGRRFDYSDQRFLTIKNNEDELTHMYNSIGHLLPLAKFLPNALINRKIARMKQLGKEFALFCKEIIQEHQQTPKNYQSTDYITAFLTKGDNTETSKHQNSVLEENFFTDKHLIGNLHALYGGGSETVQQTIQWAILYLLHYPDVQKRIHDELDLVVGRERLVSIKDRSKTPYLDATIMEIERIVSVIPINLPHSNIIRATTLGGYNIPKGALVLANLWHVHHDPQQWTDPETFNPERFLTSNGTSRPNYLIPFSIGRTSCPGEMLAKMELYLYLASMLQRFSFQSVDKDRLPDLEPDRLGLTLPTQQYSVLLKSRFTTVIE